MRLLVISDLHREVWRDAPAVARDALGRAPINLERSWPDLVVLASDIDVGERAVAWAERVFEGLPVIYVLGNHEGYGKKLDTLRERIDHACSATSNVTLLDGTEPVVGVSGSLAPLSGQTSSSSGESAARRRWTRQPQR